MIHKLKKLVLDGQLGMMIWKAQFSDKLFQSVQELCLKLDGSVDFMHIGLLLYNDRFPNLQELKLSGWVKNELIFSRRDDIAPFKTLVLHDFGNLKHVWSEGSQLVHQHLQTLIVTFCADLINLGPRPSFISFTNLTDIRVTFCQKLISLMTSTTSRSLVQLTRLEISFCSQIVEIITKQQGEGEGENEVEKEIVFEKLKSLTLESLTSLRSFCSHNYSFRFPSLEKLVIQDCQRMSMFSPEDIHAPLLKCMTFDDQKDEKLLENNLNKTIQLLPTRVRTITL